MTRFWLVFLLALSLLPSGVAAESRAPEHDHGEQQLLRSSMEYGREAIRSDGAFQSLRSVGTARLRETTPRDRTEGALPDGAVVLPTHLGPLPTRRSAPEAGAVTPLCERLPYHATAPPSRR